MEPHSDTDTSALERTSQYLLEAAVHLVSEEHVQLTEEGLPLGLVLRLCLGQKLLPHYPHHRLLWVAGEEEKGKRGGGGREN